MLDRPSVPAALAPYFEWEMDEDVAIVRLTENAIELGLDLSAHHALRRLLTTLAESPEPGAILILADAHCLSPQRCDALRMKLGAVPAGTAPENWLPREEFAAQTLIEGILKIPTPVAIALRGTVDLLLFGPAMAADLRLIDSDTVLVNRCHKLGLPPGLGLLGLLPLCIGLVQSRRILLKDGSLAAESARDLGLVDEIVPVADFESSAMEIAHGLARLSPPVVRSVKSLLLKQLPDLGEYFNLECSCIQAAVREVRSGRGRQV